MNIIMPLTLEIQEIILLIIYTGVLISTLNIFHLVLHEMHCIHSVLLLQYSTSAFAKLTTKQKKSRGLLSKEERSGLRALHLPEIFQIFYCCCGMDAVAFDSRD